MATLYCGDALGVLSTLPNESVQCCVTSPPYWGLRDYGVPGQLGLEATPEEYVEKMVAVFRGVWRVLRKDGTLWLNMGDCYAGSWSGNSMRPCGGMQRPGHPGFQPLDERVPARGGATGFGCKPKDLMGMPWRVAFGLQADGWWLRSDIIWSKPNPMPESVRDRPTRSHEYVFLLSKAERYYYDAAAIRTPATSETTKMPDGWDTGPGTHGTIHRKGREKGHRTDKQRGHSRRHAGFNDRWDQLERDEQMALGANARTVWEIAPQPYPEAHFATFPEELARRCIVAGSRPGDTVLDPFGGSGTVAQVATGNGRDSIYIDLKPEYLKLARQRIGPMLCDMAGNAESDPPWSRLEPLITVPRS